MKQDGLEQQGAAACWSISHSSLYTSLLFLSSSCTSCPLLGGGKSAVWLQSGPPRRLLSPGYCPNLVGNKQLQSVSNSLQELMNHTKQVMDILLKSCMCSMLHYLFIYLLNEEKKLKRKKERKIIIN